MAENSLFAILLRSSWWISFAVAAVIILLCGAFLPREIVLFASLGSLPFLVIGCIAAWRQARAPSSARVEAATAQAGAMGWREFADALDKAWQAEGQSVKRLPGGGAADLQLEKGGTVSLVSARRWKAASHGVEPLRDLFDSVKKQKADHGVYVVLQGTVTDNARAFAKEHGLLLLEGGGLIGLLLKHKALG